MTRGSIQVGMLSTAPWRNRSYITRRRSAGGGVVMQWMNMSQQEPRRILLQALEVLDCGLQGVALEEDAVLEVAEAIAGRAGGVANRGARLEDCAAAGEPRAPA